MFYYLTNFFIFYVLPFLGTTRSTQNQSEDQMRGADDIQRADGENW
jgi:hypothetical protein